MARRLVGVADVRTTRLVGDYGRLRTVIPAPDGSLWVTTSNRDQISNNAPAPGDDRILRLDLKVGRP